MDEESRNTVWSGYFGRWLSGTVRPVSGFKWISGVGWYYDDPELRWSYFPGDDGPWLVPKDGDDPPVETVDVINSPHRVPDAGLFQPGFHRVFAHLADGRNATRQARVLAFANRYGFLGEIRYLLYRDRTTAGSDDSEDLLTNVVNGERLEHWESAIFEAAAVVALWDRVQEGNAEALVPLIEWGYRPNASVNCMYRQGKLFSQWDFHKYINDYDEWRYGAGTVARNVILNECDGPSEPWIGDPIEAARQAVYDHVMFRLGGQVAPYLSREADTELWYVPRTLLAAIYVHLAREISGRQRQAIPCVNPRCGRYFTPSHGLQQYCTEQCRKRANYHRTKSGV